MKVYKKHKFQRLMLVSLLSVSLFSCAQSGHLIQKSYAYYFENRRNNFPMHGNEEEIAGKIDSLKALPVPAIIDTFIVVYVETKSNQISWGTAWQKEQAYLISTIPIKQNPFQVGFVKGGSQIVLTPENGIFLWQLQFSPIRSINNLPRKITNDEIILNGRYKGKKFSLKTSGLVEIVPLPPA